MNKSARNALLLSLAGYAANRFLQSRKSKGQAGNASLVSNDTTSVQDALMNTLRDAVQQKWSQAVMQADSYLKSKSQVISK